MIGATNIECAMNSAENDKANQVQAIDFCRDFIKGSCYRENCKFFHEIPPRRFLKELFRFCHDFQNRGCYRHNCKFIHGSYEDEEQFYATGKFPRDARNVPICQTYLQGACTNKDCGYVHPPDLVNNKPTEVNATTSHWIASVRDEDSPPDAKFRRYNNDDDLIEKQVLAAVNVCTNCEVLDHKVQLLHNNISILLNKVADLSEKNLQLTSMNEFLLEQSASVRNEQQCVITSRHGTSQPVSIGTVSMTPVVSLAGALPTLVTAAGNPNLALAPAASRAQLLTPAPQILTVSTTQQLMGNSGALIVTSAGAQQLMHVSDSGTLMGAGQTVVAVTPAQLTIAQPAQQLMSGPPQNAVQQLVQQSALQPQLAAQHQNAQYASQQSVQHLAAQQNAQHLAAQQNAQHLAAQQNAQHLAAQQNAQHLAAQQNAQHLAAQQNAQQLAVQQSQQLAAQQSAQQLAVQQSQQLVAQQSAQQLAAQQNAAQQQLVPNPQLVHQTSTQQITISSTSQQMALPNSQTQTITFPMISQNMMPHCS